jgi:hypothetical protein
VWPEKRALTWVPIDPTQASGLEPSNDAVDDRIAEPIAEDIGGGRFAVPPDCQRGLEVGRRMTGERSSSA